MPEYEPIEVPCPTCKAPRNTECRTVVVGGDRFHGKRYQSARVYHATVATNEKRRREAVEAEERKKEARRQKAAANKDRYNAARRAKRAAQKKQEK